MIFSEWISNKQRLDQSSIPFPPVHFNLFLTNKPNSVQFYRLLLFLQQDRRCQQYIRSRRNKKNHNLEQIIWYYKKKFHLECHLECRIYATCECQAECNIEYYVRFHRSKHVCILYIVFVVHIIFQTVPSLLFWFVETIVMSSSFQS